MNKSCPHPPRRRRLLFDHTSETPAACLPHSFPHHPLFIPASLSIPIDEEEDWTWFQFLGRKNRDKYKMAKTRQFEQKVTTPSVREHDGVDSPDH
jgi:hypothetical protein